MQAPDRKPVPGIVFDSALDQSIDQVLALAMVFGFQSKRETRTLSLSVSRNNLKVAAFCDVVSRFYGAGSLPIGMATNVPAAETAPMLMAVLNRPGASTAVKKLNDTADVAALIRNALTAQVDQNAVVVLAGPPTDLLEVLALPSAKELIAKKARLLTIAATAGSAAAFQKLLGDWPTPVVFAGDELNRELPFPGESIEKDFAWAPNHPVVAAYRASNPMPYDAPSQAMAAVLYAARPDGNYFKLSDPGTVTVLDNGTIKFTPSAQGKHRYLIVDPAQKQNVVQAYTEIASAKPPARPGQPQKAAANLLVAGLVGSLLLTGAFRVSGQAQPTFDKAVRPVLANTCMQCHNDQLASGGLSMSAFTSAESIVQNRAAWEMILRRVRGGEMPPPGIARPSGAQITALVDFAQAELDRADRSVQPDPGRVTAHRLNRNEYSNTIRDLLGVDFRAEKYFPTDDSGDGFDNIGEVLTVSPVLMEKYMTAAERIASWAISTEIPSKPIQVEYALKDRRIRRVDPSTVEAVHRVEFAGDYTVRFGLPGERAADAKPVMLGFWMDGQLLKSMQVETKPSGLVYFDPYSDAEMTVYLPEGDHTFRAGFIGDDFVKALDAKDLYNNKKNKFLNSILFIGPTRSKIEKESRKKILICDPKSGQACAQRIVSTLARHAYRRPVTRGEVASLMRFVDLAKSDGQTAEQGIQLAIQAMLVSPNFLFHIERNTGSSIHQVSDVELASRLSYFLWSSMPDDALLSLAESGKLRAPGALEAQIKRMLADSRASALAANFAGQWLETRNLDTVSPDPKKFPEWGPELRDAMKTETTLFFEHMLRENRPISEFLDAKYTFLNDRLAKFYGIDGVTGPDFRRVELTTDERGGLLSQAGVLTVSSYPSRTSPVIRGKYVLQNILGAPPPPPPPDVPVLDEKALGTLGSMRQQLEKHRSDTTCASCHARMDPLGFGLENYDAIGKWRTKDGNFPVDASGTLPDGKTFSTPAEMRAILVAQLPEFSRTLIEKMMIYALGRGLRTYDGRTVDNMNRDLAANGYRFQTLIQQMVQSLPFQERREEGPAEKTQ